MRVWCRVLEEGDYASINVATAAAGFRSIGSTMERYAKMDDILRRVTKNDTGTLLREWL